MRNINDLSKKYGGIVQVLVNHNYPSDIDKTARHFNLERRDGESDESLEERIKLASIKRRMDLMRDLGKPDDILPNLPSGDQK